MTAALPLRFAFVVHSFPIHSEAFIVNQAAALIEAGHEVDLIPLWGMRPCEPADFPIAQRAGLFARVRDPGFPLAIAARLRDAPRLARARFQGRWPVLLRSLNPLLHGRRALNLRLLYETAVFEPQRPYDVVHCQFADLAPMVLQQRACGAFDAPVVVHVRGVDITRRVREFGLATYQRIFRDADLLLANCEHFRQTAIGLGCPAAKVEVFRSAIDLREFRLRSAPENKGPLRLVSVNRLVEKKGLAYAVQALALLAATGVDAELEILGDGPLRSTLAAQAETLGVAQRIHWRGAASHAQVIAALQAADLFLATSVTAPDGDQDAPVNSIKEALAIGLPVVATQHGGIPEMIVDGVSGRLVPERDAAALAEAVRWMLTRRAEWPQFAEAGRQVVERDYNLARQTDWLAGRITRLLADRHAGRSRS